MTPPLQRALAAALLALALSLSLACGERQAGEGAPAASTAASPAPPASPAPASAPAADPRIARAARPGRRVVFVGLDGADWELLDPLMAEGVMPNLAALVRAGRSGVLTTIHPPLSP